MLKLQTHVNLKLISVLCPSSSLHSSRFCLKRKIGRTYLLKRNHCYYHKGRVGSTMSPETSQEPIIWEDKINLTDEEEKIFQRLLDVVRHYNMKTELRVAGGWVRDKLLGRECYDIDVALDDMYGRQFCEKIKDYLGEEDGHEGGYCVIQSNPEQSKHLETARMRVFNMMIDFVNLRSERYCDDSRIPEMEFGSPRDDALRRDLTINSLFYNISTRSIEDYTGRGLEDLKCGRIVTPSPARDTFLEDPLRVLRAVRFGARFDFLLDKELKLAATDATVRTALKEKISRERIGHEIDLMVSGNQPVKAISWIQEFQLFWVVFAPPSITDPPLNDESDRACITYMNSAWDALQLLGSSTFSDEQRRLYLYSALFLPLRESFYTDRKSKKVPTTSHIFRQSLKLKVSDAETVLCIHEASERFIHFIDSLEVSDTTGLQSDLDDEEEFSYLSLVAKRRIFAGLTLRRIKDFWRVALLISTLLYYPKSGENEGGVLTSGCCQLNSKVQLFERVEKAIAELNLDKVWETKPLLDGNAIMSILHVKGKQIGEWQQKLLKWQLAHPEETADDCREWIKQSHSKRMKLS